MLLIYTTNITTRINYIFDLVIADLAGIDYRLTSDKAEYINATCPKMQYANSPIDDSFFVGASELLFQNHLHEFLASDLIVINQGDLSGLFAVNESSEYSFDIFGSAFFWVTLYEEYHAVAFDSHSRFHAQQSILYINGLLQKPLVNHYALSLRSKLKAKFPALNFRAKKFTALASVDIDMAYCYKEKGVLRNIGGLLKDLFSFKINAVAKRIKVLLGIDKDPFDTFDYIQNIVDQNSIPLIYFLLLGKHSEQDKNIDPNNINFQKLIQKITAKNDAGIHFSYQSHFRKNGYQTELAMLKEIIKKPISKNRFHYLKFSVPTTYQQIIREGVLADFSMGYASEVGFRAAIACPFYFFDVEKNCKTNLQLVPFQYMDVTLKEYQRRHKQQAKETIKNLIDTTAAVEGQFVSIWHNNSLSDTEGWQGWKSVFEYTMQYCNEKSKT